MQLPPVTSMVSGIVSMDMSHLTMNNSQSEDKENIAMGYMPATTLPVSDDGVCLYAGSIEIII